VRTTIFLGSPGTNGVYSYTIVVEDTTESGMFPIWDDDTARLQQKPPLVFSGGNGEFFLGVSTLGICRTFNGETISDSVSIVLVKEGYTTLVEGVRLRSSQIVDGTFTLSAL
jgi:hypothetical protein